jgi:hypothetical protein
MKKLFPTSTTRPSFIDVLSARAKAYVFGVLILFASCTNTQVRWDAMKMRQDVMVYYNDQIMENLIKANNHLPFVHVDIDLLTSTGASQISGSVGYGETITNTGANALATQTTTTNVTGVSHQVTRVVGGLLETASHVAMRPFSYNVTPQRSETLSINLKPALGSQALASPAPAPDQSSQPTPEPTYEVTKKTTTTGPTGTQTTIEETLKPKGTPTPSTIYELYQNNAKEPKPCKKKPCNCGGVLSHSSTEPQKGTYLPGTLKKWRKVPGTPQKYDIEYYYISACHTKEYYDFCKQLFTKGQTGSLESQLETTRARVETINTQLATPLPP